MSLAQGDRRPSDIFVQFNYQKTPQKAFTNLAQEAVWAPISTSIHVMPLISNCWQPTSSAAAAVIPSK